MLGWPAGGAFATADDLVSFANALQADDLLDPAFTHLATSPKHLNDSPLLTDYIGYAAIDLLVNDQWVLGHNGAFKGADANLDWFPDTDWHTGRTVQPRNRHPRIPRPRRPTKKPHHGIEGVFLCPQDPHARLVVPPPWRWHW